VTHNHALIDRAGPGGDARVRDVKETATLRVKTGLAEMLKGGVIMDVVTAEQAKIAEAAGAVSVMALERVPADIRDPGHGEGPDRPLRRGAGAAGT
jgi:hypothetical protein